MLAAIGGLKEGGKARGPCPFSPHRFPNDEVISGETVQKIHQQAPDFYEAENPCENPANYTLVQLAEKLAEVNVNQVRDVAKPITDSALSAKDTELESTRIKHHEKVPRITEEYLVEKLKSLTTVGEYSERAFFWNGQTYELVTAQSVGSYLLNHMTKQEKYGISVAIFAKVSERLNLEISSCPLHLVHPRHILYCLDGCIDINTGEVVERDPRWLLTFQIQAKLGKKSKAPYFSSFENTMSREDNEIIERLRYTMAFLLFQGLPSKVLILMTNAPDSGKSQLMQFIIKLIGEQNCCSVPPDKFCKSFAVSIIPGKAIVHSMEVSEEPLSPDNVTVLKKLTGSDTMDFEVKYESPRSFRPFAKVVPASNHCFQLKKYDSGIYHKRLKIVPFLHSVPIGDQDPDLVEHLFAERHAILKLLLPYCRDLLQNNFRFPDCAAADYLLLQSMQLSTDTIRDYLRNCCEPDPNSIIPSSVLHEDYMAWCEKSNRKPIDSAWFSRIILRHVKIVTSEKHYVDNKQVRCLRGIRIREE